MLDKEKLAIQMAAHIIFPWAIEQILHLKFPGEVSRAQASGYVSVYRNTTYI